MIDNATEPAPIQLQAVRLYNARAGRPCARNSILESCGFVHDFSSLSLLPHLQSYELTQLLSSTAMIDHCCHPWSYRARRRRWHAMVMEL
jgi:hypothetical protein